MSMTLNPSQKGRLDMLRQQAGLQYQSGHHAEALDLVRQMISIEPHDPATQGLAALISLNLGKRGQATKFLKSQRRALDRAPSRPESYLGHAGLWREAGDLTRVVDALVKSIQLWPDHVLNRIQLAEALKDIGRFDDAEAEARRAIELDAERDDAWALLAIALHKLERFEDAAAAYEKARSLGHDPSISHNWGAALVAAGRAEDAVQVCDEWLKFQPGNVEALALKGHALQEAGRVDEAVRLFNFDHYVRARQVSAPEGYLDLAAFNEALADCVIADESLKTPPENDLRYHHPKLKIAGGLEIDKDGPLADLRAEIGKAVDQYLESLKAEGESHPFPASRPANYDITAWGAVLDGGGNQNQHVHKDGYFSGCYYITVPEEISSEENGIDGDIAGGFEVGRPPPELGCKQEHITKQFKPQEGLMLLFPAYFYHRTIPFSGPFIGSRKRICIAFDVIPV